MSFCLLLDTYVEGVGWEKNGFKQKNNSAIARRFFLSHQGKNEREVKPRKADAHVND
jgi:hypothetical protein